MKTNYSNASFSTQASRVESAKRIPLDKQTLKELMSQNISRFCKRSESVLSSKGNYERDYVKMDIVGRGNLKP